MENSARDIFARDVLLGLSSEPKRLSPKYIYDDEGSRLFEDIMNLPEYYLTRSEFNILQNQKASFASAAGDEPFNLVELGAGNGEKTKILLEYFKEEGLDHQYVPIDISEAAIEQLVGQLKKDLPDLEVNGLVKEYFEGLQWLRNNSDRRNFILFMGANIGNLGPAEARNFLQSLWLSLSSNDLICIGFDLKKDYKTITAAYDDSQGVTARFNMNLLSRINKELGGDFHMDKFKFYSTYNPMIGANEAFLVSLEEQDVEIKYLEKAFRFEKWEPIHTEYSFKFSVSEIERMANANGFQVMMHLFDAKYYFVDSIWKIYK